MSTGKSRRRPQDPSHHYQSASDSDPSEMTIEKRPAFIPTPESSTRLKIRLDLNLDVDIQIRARVHGDVTLSLQ